MKRLDSLVQNILQLRASGKKSVTLLAVCPNSEAVLEAAVKSAAQNNCPMLFAATLNQVDRDGGYTSWTPATFVSQMSMYTEKYGWAGPLYPCLDHGGPWLKDVHTIGQLNFLQTMAEVKLSLSACLQAGYQLLHIDTTVDRTLPAGQPVDVRTVVNRTLDLIEYAEVERKRMNLDPIAYEVGSEEVHGGLADLKNFQLFLRLIKSGLGERNLESVPLAFFVAQVGTDLHTSLFDPIVAEKVVSMVTPEKGLIKGHYTDGVSNLEDYPKSGMGGANVGPEFTTVELMALGELCKKEVDLCQNRPELLPSEFLNVVELEVIRSGRWIKWLQPDEIGMDFSQLSSSRKTWLISTGARYIWTSNRVVVARKQLYSNLSRVMSDPHQYVIDRICASIDRYVNAFHLFDILTLIR
jgi:tagatose-1,6-bisphosphate aldolase non-catalytic subunit AgaZ/GatZ